MAISTKTESRRSADTNDNVSMTVCDTTGSCCTSVLNNVGNDRKRGHVDTYTDPSVLGECFTTHMKGQLNVTLTKDRTNGWYVDWAQVSLARGISFTCMFNSWLDDSTGYSNQMTVQCDEG